MQRAAQSLFAGFQSKTEKEVILKSKIAEVLHHPDKFQDKIIGFIPDHLALGCTTGVTLYKLNELPYQATLAIRQPIAVAQPAESSVNNILASLTVNHAQSHYSVYDINSTDPAAQSFQFYQQKLISRKPYHYILSEEGTLSQVCSISNRVIATQSLVENSSKLLSGYLIAHEVFYEKEWRTVLVAVLNYQSKTNDSIKSMVRIFEITNMNESDYTSSKIFAKYKTVSLVPELHQLIKPVFIRLPQQGFGLAIAGIEVNQKRPCVLMVFFESTLSALIPIPSKSIAFLTAIDTIQSYYSDLLMISADKLYQVDLKTKTYTLKPWADLMCTVPPLFVRTANEMGFQTIALGMASATSQFGIFLVKTENTLKLLTALDPKEYQAICCQWGFVRLLPQNKQGSLKEIDLSTEQIKTLISNDSWGDIKKQGLISWRKLK